MKLSSLEVNYSREHGYFIVECNKDGSDMAQVEKVAELLGKEEGIIYSELEDGEYAGFCWDKAWHDIDTIRKLYKAAKAA